MFFLNFTFFISGLSLFYCWPPPFFLYTMLSSSQPCISFLGTHRYLPRVWLDPTNTTRGHFQIFQYIVFGMRWGGGGHIHQSEDIILAWFLSRDSHARSCFGRIRTVARCYANPFLVSGGGSTLKHYRVGTHGSRKWDPPTTEEAFLLQEQRYSFYKSFFVEGWIIAWCRGYFRMYRKDGIWDAGLFPDNWPPKPGR